MTKNCFEVFHDVNKEFPEIFLVYIIFCEEKLVNSQEKQAFPFSCFSFLDFSEKDIRGWKFTH